MPTPSGRQDSGWYSFEQGPVHFVVMDSELSAANGSSQLRWIEADLEAVDRSVTPWVVVGGHRPMYSGSDAMKLNSSGFDLANGPWWPDVEAVLVQHSVDLCE